MTTDKRNELINSLPNEARDKIKEIERLVDELRILRNQGELTDTQYETSFRLIYAHQTRLVVNRTTDDRDELYKPAI